MNDLAVLATVKKSDGKATLLVQGSRFYQSKLNEFQEGTTVLMTVKKYSGKRSEEQNRYYWLYLNHISDETGHTPEEIHEWAKSKFLTSGIREIFGDKVRVRGSTTKLNKIDFGEYIRKIELETGIQSPPTSGVESNT